MDTNYQGGDRGQKRGYYYDAIQFIPEGKPECLDIGSGTALEFEKEVVRSHPQAIMDCLDLFLPDQQPSYIRKFYKASIEEKIKIQEYDMITCFEVIEHIDNTDALLKNCYNNLKPDGIFMISIPNLSSLYSRAELLMGLQPHVLEVSNQQANLGGGIFARLNNPSNEPLHHIRGITYKALKELLRMHKFETIRAMGYDHRAKWLFRNMPSLAPTDLLICKKRF